MAGDSATVHARLIQAPAIALTGLIVTLGVPGGRWVYGAMLYEHPLAAPEAPGNLISAAGPTENPEARQDAAGQPIDREDKDCLSAGCHAVLVEPKHVHEPVAARECQSCHELTDRENHKYRLVSESIGDLCLKCHQESFAAYTALAHVHPPVRDKQCSACHTSHASAHAGLLVEAFVPDLYVPADDGESVALCFECHDIEALEDEETDEYTDFRNGEQNLHYLHVNRESKGRNCRVCHLPHGTNQDRMIRSVVPYGDWQMKIHFVPTDTGGYCGPACHPAKRYDRSQAIDFSQEPVAPDSSGEQP